MMITENLSKKEILLILCLKISIANNNPTEPPQKAIVKSVFSGMRNLLLTARYLSYPATAKEMIFTIKK